MATSKQRPMSASKEIQANADEKATRDMKESLKFYAYTGDWEAAQNMISSDPNRKKIDPHMILDCASKGGSMGIFQ